MKTRTKITVTLAVGIGLLVGSMGVASASPHYSDWNGKTGFTALDNSFSHNLEWDLKAPVTSFEDSNVIMQGNSTTVNVTSDRSRPKASQSVRLDTGPVNYELKNVQVTSVEDVDQDSDSDNDMKNTTVGVSDIWTSGGTTSVWTSGGVTSIWTNGSGTRLYANFVPFSF